MYIDILLSLDLRKVSSNKYVSPFMVTSHNARAWAKNIYIVNTKEGINGRRFCDFFFYLICKKYVAQVHN